MKKKLIAASAVLCLVTPLFLTHPQEAKATTNTSTAAFAEKQERMNQRLEKILAKVDVQVQAKVTEKFEAKKVALAEAEKKVAAEKAAAEAKATADKAAAEAKELADQQAQQAAEQANAQATTEVVTEAPVNAAENTTTESAADSTEVPSNSNDTSWQEYKSKGQEYGERLSDPNLTPEQRRDIINEKIDYYKNR